MKSSFTSNGSQLKPASVILLLVLFAAVAGIVFHALWTTPGAVLMTSDDNLGHISTTHRMLQTSWTANWTGDVLWGMPGVSGLHMWALAIRTLPPRVFMNIYHIFCLVLSSWFLALYLRDKGLRTAACVFGALTGFWVGTNLTLLYAGHIGKYGTMMFLSLSIFALGRWGTTGRAAWALLAGAAAGAMYMEQPDVSLFSSLLLIPLGLYEAYRAAGGWNPVAIVRQSWAPALAAVLLAGGTSLVAVVSGVTEVPGSETEEGRWAYITQWSQPPDESLDFIAPGWAGWRSGEENGPYWGRTGRTEGWERTQRGFPNFRLETVYVGAIPLLFALIGLTCAFWRRHERHSAAILVWGGLCILALLLSFGKYFPLYRIIAMLPGFGSIRNPNKFIHFFQIAWAVTAAFGLDAALRLETPRSRRWQWGAAAAGGILLIFGLIRWAEFGPAGIERTAVWWADQLGVPVAARAVPEQWARLTAMARAIEWNKAFAVTYAGIAFLLGAAILWLLSAGKARPTGIVIGGKPTAPGQNPIRKRALAAMWIPALAIVFDAAVILAPQYIRTMPPGYVAENELIRYLKRELGHNRTAMVTQDGFYNLWLTYLYPYHGIPSVNVTQLPRPPADYMAFWNAVQDPVRMWRLASVSHILARGSVARKLLENPDWARQLELVWAYQPADDGQGGVAARPVPATLQAPEVVLKMKNTAPRVAAIASWRETADSDALRILANPAVEPLAAVLLAPDSGVPPPVNSDAPAATVEVRKIVSGRYEFSVENQAPVVVRISEKYDPNWRATVNGRPAPVLRADFMFQGIALADAGRHDVTLLYSPPLLPVLMQAAGLLAGLGAMLWLAATGIARPRTANAA